jgi:hypothetical protein
MTDVSDFRIDGGNISLSQFSSIEQITAPGIEIALGSALALQRIIDAAPHMRKLANLRFHRATLLAKPLQLRFEFGSAAGWLR